MIKPTLYIKNMVCPRCIEAVQDILYNSSIQINHIELGKVIIDKEIPNKSLTSIKEALQKRGFELLQDKNQQIIEEIKTCIIDIFHYNNIENSNKNMSDYLSNKIGYEYSYLSSTFSVETGITIEKFIIAQKIEKVKELLDYDELSLKEISYQLRYSSVQHLSYQFKNVTGITPTNYKKQKRVKRKSLNSI